ncbi:5-carboxymethyl-2-hydroxymuconate isomerase [Piscinibacter sp.]|jgi:5-carboxymethyl-2-hydroxymuconate isomerase|uniref:5-carboxymethyl-2-hydroxymuconate isomerase n=1 Tax=Piscinibacter sp. TaxID=1903157 RepID=UPI00355AAD3E
MPHLVILYSGNLDARTDMSVLCRRLADTMLAQRDEAGQPVFPPGGTRVFAYPAAHFAVSDGGAAGRAAGSNAEYGFAYLNLRMGRGRSEAVQQGVGRALMAEAKAHFEPLMVAMHLGVTLQIDVGAEVFDAKHSTLHPLFNKPD